MRPIFLIFLKKPITSILLCKSHAPRQNPLPPKVSGPPKSSKWNSNQLSSALHHWRKQCQESWLHLFWRGADWCLYICHAPQHQPSLSASNYTLQIQMGTARKLWLSRYWKTATCNLWKQLERSVEIMCSIQTTNSNSNQTCSNKFRTKNKYKHNDKTQACPSNFDVSKS